MLIPSEFKQLATCFYSRSDREYDTAEAWVMTTTRDALTTNEKIIVRTFVTDLLARATDTELQELWNSLDSDYWLDEPGGARRFFETIRKALQ